MRTIVSATEEEVEDIDRFRAPLREAISLWDRIAPELGGAVARKPSLRARVSTGFLHALAADGSRLTSRMVEQLRNIVRKKGKLTPPERVTLVEILRPYLDHAHTQLVLSKSLDAPVFDWVDVGPIYRKVLSPRISNQTQISQDIPAVRELFAMGLHAVEPDGIDSFQRAIQDSRIRQFRTVVSNAAAAGTTLDPKLAENLGIEIGQLQRRSHSMARVVSIFSAIGAFVADHAAGGNLGVAALAAGGVAALGEFTTHAVLKHVLFRNKGWFLCLSEAKRISRIP